MNKKNCKNEPKQQTKKREYRPASRDSAATKRQVRASPVTAIESGLNFVVNVSSSGTNLNKKIELELAKLNSVEKKIRKHKCKATAVTSTKPPTCNTSNQRKLHNILESMLTTMNYASPKSKKCTPFHQNKLTENDTDTGKKCSKPTKNPPNHQTTMIDSFTDLSFNNKKFLKTTLPKTDTIFLKSATKKPISAPSGNHSNILADDLRFAESLRFGKNVDLHFTLSDLKNMSRSSTNTKRQGSNREMTPQKNDNSAKFNNLSKNFKVVIEQPSKSKISYVYDSTSFDCINATGLSVDLPKWPIDPIRNVKKPLLCERDKRISRNEEINLELNSKEGKAEIVVVEKKPKEKKFYSYLKRGNFTISGCVEDDDNGNREHNSDEETKTVIEGLGNKPKKDPGRCDNEGKSTENKEDVAIGRLVDKLPSGNEEANQDHSDENIGVDKFKTFNLENLTSHLDHCHFPTELLERSILAVENVLHTIDSMAYEFNMSTEIRDPFFGEIEALETLEDLLEVTSVDQLVNKLRKDGLSGTADIDDGQFQDKPDGDQLPRFGKCSSEINKKIPKSSKGSFSVSKPTILFSGDSNSVQGTRQNSLESTKIKGKSFSERRSLIDVIYLKPPVKNFQNSEENFPKKVASGFSIVTEKSGNKKKYDSLQNDAYVISNIEEDIDPLMMALESLRNRVNAMEEEMVDVSPKRSIFKPHDIDNTISCTNENFSEKVCSELKGRRIPVRELLISKTFSNTSCHSLATSQSENNFTTNHSCSLSYSSDASRASSRKKYSIPPKYSSKFISRQSNRLFNNRVNEAHDSCATSFKESNKTITSKMFPDYYIDRCLKLLRKKFKDFDNLRHKEVFQKKSNYSMRSEAFEHLEKADESKMVTCKVENVTTPKKEKLFHPQTEMLWINNTKENYKVCFKNENFQIRSETSIESCSKAVMTVVKKKNVYTLSRIKSSP